MTSNSPPRSVLRLRSSPSVGSRLGLLRPLLTSRSGSTPSPFQAQGEISPGKNALLHCTTAGSTPPRLDHKGFAVSGPLALLGSAFYPVLVHRLAIYAPRFLPTLGRPHAVALHFVRCDQLTAGLAPAGVRPCWAHIGIGGSHYRLRPCHTTRHAGPHRAVREVEVMRAWADPAGRSDRCSAHCSGVCRCYATSAWNLPPRAVPHPAPPRALAVRDTWSYPASIA